MSLTKKVAYNTIVQAGGKFLDFSEDVIDLFGNKIKGEIADLYKGVGGKESTIIENEDIQVVDGEIIISSNVLKDYVLEGFEDINGHLWEMFTFI